MRLYSINHQDVSPAASIQTLIEFTAGAVLSCCVVRANCSQKGSTTTNQQDISIQRKTAVGTNVTAPNARQLDPGDAAFGGTVRGLETTEGTVGDVDYPDSFNWVNGWTYLPYPDERVWQPGAGIQSLRLPTAPPSGLVVNASILIGEVG